MSTSRERTEAILFGAKDAPTASPSARIGVAPKTQRGYGIPNREPTSELEPRALRGSSGNPGQLDRMERGHPRIAAGVRSLELAVAARPPVLVGHEDETALEAAFRETMQAAVIDAPYVDASNGAGGWSLLAQHLAAYWHRGAFIGSARLVSKAGSTYPLPYLNGLAVEVFPVHLSSVQDWITARDDRSRLIGVRQQTTDQGQVEIPGDRLIHLQHGGAVGIFEGVSLMRPLVFLFERWAGIMTARERNAHLQGGLNVVGSPAAVSEDDQAVLLQWLDAVGLPYIAMPQGYAPADLDTRYASGSQGSDGEFFQYVDAQIDRVFGEALQSLGSSSHGSRALGEELSDDGDWQRAASLQMLYDAFVHRVGSWLAGKVGYTGRLPLVSLDADAGEDPREVIELVGAALTSGALTRTLDIENRIRETLGLDLVEALPQVPVPEPESPSPRFDDDHACGASCSHDHRVELSDAESIELAENRVGPHTVIGADGITFRTHVESLEGPETFVAWATLDQDRRSADQSMRAEIGRAMDAHRADTWSALRDGWQPGERDQVRNRATERYASVLESYRDSVALVIGRHAAQEFQRQSAAGIAPVAPSEGVAPSALGARDSRIDAQIQIVAEGMAGRVQSEVETAWGMGRDRGSFAPAITAAMLAAPALVIGSSVEAAGRVEYARTVGAAVTDGRGGPEVAPGPAGLRIVRVIRSSVADNNRCQHCEDRHGNVYEFPRDLDKWNRAENQLPDPNCAGAGRWGNNCRCGWLIEWGRDGD